MTNQTATLGGTRISEEPDRCLLQELPPEIRMHILSYLIHRRSLVRNILNRQNETLILRGATAGVCHVRVVRKGEDWRVVSIVKPVLHNDTTGLLYRDLLFVLEVLSPRADSLWRKDQPAIIAGPSNPSMFIRWMNHVQVRQDINPHDDLLGKAHELESILVHLRPDRKSSDVSLLFKGFTGGYWGHPARFALAWPEYVAYLQGLDLGRNPEVMVWKVYDRTKGWEMFEALAVSLGARFDDPDHIYW